MGAGDETAELKFNRQAVQREPAGRAPPTSRNGQDVRPTGAKRPAPGPVTGAPPAKSTRFPPASAPRGGPPVRSSREGGREVACRQYQNGNCKYGSSCKFAH